MLKINLLGFFITMKTQLFLLFFSLLLFSSCEKAFINNADNSPRGNFEAFWQEVDRIYPYFEAKGINWDEIYDQFSPQVTDNTNPEDLFNTLSDMAYLLQDGHVDVYSPYGTASFDFKEGHPLNEPTHALTYMDDRISNSVLTFATVKDLDSIGYIQIRTFAGSISEFERIEEIINDFQDKKGIIIDVRSNGGGSDFNSLTIAGRFADKSRLYRLVTFRNGPEWDDFADWTHHYVDPMGSKQFHKPVVLLTNRSCFSACEGFTRMMKVFPNVTMVGDTTAGGSGSPLFRELPNGWEYRLSTWLVAEPETFDVLEGKGIAPDIQINISKADSLAGIDTILEKAIELIEE